MTALVTGASSGIGASFATALAREGSDLLLVARRLDRLTELAETLTRDHGVRALTHAADLTDPQAIAGIEDFAGTKGLHIDTLINNAGFATRGDVREAAGQRLRDQVDVNCQAVVDLTTRFLPAMVERNEGRIVNVASTAAFQPVPHMAVYSASKAFVLTFTEALWAEVRHTGVRVTALCPGSTETEFFDHTGKAAMVGRLRSPDGVVQTAFAALEAGRASTVDGFGNRVVARVGSRLLPRRAALRIAGRLVRK